jgi:hypothetical protein
MATLGNVDPLLYTRVGDEVTLTPAGLARCFQVANGVKLGEQELFTLTLICRSTTGVQVDGASVVFLASKGWIRHAPGRGYAHTATGYNLLIQTDSEAARLLERIRNEARS